MRAVSRTARAHKIFIENVQDDLDSHPYFFTQEAIVVKLGFFALYLYPSRDSANCARERRGESLRNILLTEISDSLRGRR